MAKHSTGKADTRTVRVKSKDVAGFERALHGSGSYAARHRQVPGGPTEAQQRAARQSVPRQRNGK